MLSTMGVHTFDIVITTPYYDDVEVLFNNFNFPKVQRKRIKEMAKDGEDLLARSKSAFMRLGENYPGIKYMSVFQSYADNNYYIKMEIEPEELLLGRPTVSLFLPGVYRNSILTKKFRNLMSTILEGELSYMCTLANWNCRRIDYTMNIQMKSQEDVELFEQITKKVNVPARTKHLYIQEKTEQSTAYANKSWKIINYNKKREIEEAFQGYPDIDKLVEEAEGISRFEVQCYNAKVKGLKRKYSLSSRSIMNYLDWKMLYDIIRDRYEAVVGYGDFYSRKSAKRKITASNLSENKKDKAYRFLRLASQCENLTEVKEKFLAGAYVREGNQRVLVKGGDTAYQSIMEMLTELNINPILLPADCGRDRLPAPIDRFDLVPCTYQGLLLNDLIYGIDKDIKVKLGCAGNF